MKLFPILMETTKLSRMGPRMKHVSIISLRSPLDSRSYDEQNPYAVEFMAQRKY